MVNYSYSEEDNGNGSFNYDGYNYSGEGNGTVLREYTYHPDYYILYRFCISILIFGIWGNGMVIWLLCVRIKSNYFATYILNHAIANVGFLVNSIICTILYISKPLDIADNQIAFTYFILFDLLHSFTFCSSLFFLTVISIDRCVSVFFPVWHQRHQPANLSGFVCALVWLLAFLPNIIWFIHYTIGVHRIFFSGMYHLIVNGFFCLSLMTISSLLLSIKAFCKSKPRRREKLLKTVLLTIFFFLLCSIPFSVSHLIIYIYNQGFIFYLSLTFCACLSSSVNPLIYYLVGRPKKECSNKSMEAVLEKLFKEGEI